MNINNAPITQARFNEILKDFDVNKDGKVDQLDLQKFKNASNVEQGVFGLLKALVPFASLFVPEKGGNQVKAEMLSKLLAGDNDGVIRRDDVGRGCSNRYRNHGGCSTPTRRPISSGSLNDALKSEYSRAGSEVKKLTAAMKKAKTPEEKQELMMKLQEWKDLQAFLTQLRTSLQKRHHDSMMSIARNMA